MSTVTLRLTSTHAPPRIFPFSSASLELWMEMPMDAGSHRARHLWGSSLRDGEWRSIRDINWYLQVTFLALGLRLAFLVMVLILVNICNTPKPYSAEPLTVQLDFLPAEGNGIWEGVNAYDRWLVGSQGPYSVGDYSVPLSWSAATTKSLLTLVMSRVGYRACLSCQYISLLRFGNGTHTMGSCGEIYTIKVKSTFWGAETDSVVGGS